MEEQGKCPKCGSGNLSYGTIESNGEAEVSYPFVCEDCGCTADEVYSLSFIGHYQEERV